MPNIRNNAESNRRNRTHRAESAAARTAQAAVRQGTAAQASPAAPAPKPAPQEKYEKSERLFALDIGTRSVIGIVADRDTEGTLHVLATARKEHQTRAMLDGQIHDVPQVVSVIQQVKAPLEEKYGPLKSAAVAAAGRALYTETAEAELEVHGVITAEMQRNLDFAGVQAAQALLANSQTLEDPSRYCCVGYSTIRYVLDDVQLKSLIGQHGRHAKATVIATFLPRQVIDSMHSALHAAGLDMKALTLEPIAAINVLIPPTMRHLNLVLVDIGAGTSDIAITNGGSVTAYGMVPLAGDEITEAISQRFLLDFNVAERIKREAAEGKDVHFADILGIEYDLSAEQVIEPVLPNIQHLAEAIAKQIAELNADTPQAVMLVGGGALTPRLQECVSEALKMPIERVAVRHPDTVLGVANLPPELHRTDAVTPLGILKIASLNTLHFLSVFVNDEEYSLFNFRELTIADALLSAGLSLKKYNGKPGLGLMVSLGGESKSFPGTMGSMARLQLDGEDAELDTIVHDGSHITIIPGEDGTTPEVRLGDLVTTGREYLVYINGREKHLVQHVTVNGEIADSDRLLADGDVIESRELKSIGEALLNAGYPPQGRKISYTLNGEKASYSCKPEILLDDLPATLSQPVHEGDHLEYIAGDEPKLADVLNISELDTALNIYYQGRECKVPLSGTEIQVNGRKASAGTILSDGCAITYKKNTRVSTTVSEALLAVGFVPPAANSRLTFTILVNEQPVDFTDPVKNGDKLDVQFTPLDSSGAPAPATPPTRNVSAPSLSSLNEGMQPAAPEQQAKENKRNLTLADFIRHD